MFFARPILFFSCFGLTVALVGCSGLSVMSKAGKFYDKDGPPDTTHSISFQDHKVLKIEKPYKAANRPYTVMGKRYYPMSGDREFTQTGIASWYGKQFHGRKTAIGERYDMFAMTAAHPTMELPSYARVTNLKNGQSVIVRVNDRGPFLGGRIIDMSYAAAVKLGYHKAGTARVKVERITRRDIASGNYQTKSQKTLLAYAEPVNQKPQVQETLPRVESVTEVPDSTQRKVSPPALAATDSVTTVSATPSLSPVPSAENPGASAVSEAVRTPEITENPVIDIGTVQNAPEISDATQSDAIASILSENELALTEPSSTAATPTWSVQIGAFSNEINASEAAAHAEMMLSEHDIKTRVRVASDGTLYRVLIGSEENRQVAQKLCESIGPLLGIRAFVIQR